MSTCFNALDFMHLRTYLGDLSDYGTKVKLKKTIVAWLEYQNSDLMA